MHRRIAPSLVISTVTFLGVVVPNGASATVDMGCSEPTHAVCANSDAGTDISKDHDGDYTTVTKSQVVSAHWAVENNTDQDQTVRVRLVLDGPGISHDQTLVGGWVMSPQELRQGNVDLFKVHPKNTPTGTYSWTVTANGTESITVSSTFTVY